MFKTYIPSDPHQGHQVDNAQLVGKLFELLENKTWLSGNDEKATLLLVADDQQQQQQQQQSLISSSSSCRDDDIFMFNCTYVFVTIKLLVRLCFFYGNKIDHVNEIGDLASNNNVFNKKLMVYIKVNFDLLKTSFIKKI